AVRRQGRAMQQPSIRILRSALVLLLALACTPALAQERERGSREARSTERSQPRRAEANRRDASDAAGPRSDARQRASSQRPQAPRRESSTPQARDHAGPRRSGPAARPRPRQGPATPEARRLRTGAQPAASGRSDPARQRGGEAAGDRSRRQQAMRAGTDRTRPASTGPDRQPPRVQTPRSAQPPRVARTGAPQTPSWRDDQPRAQRERTPTRPRDPQAGRQPPRADRPAQSRNAVHDRADRERHQARIQADRQRAEQFRRDREQRQRQAEQRRAEYARALQQQRRLAQYRYQRDYYARLHEQERRWRSASWDYARDPFYSTPPSYRYSYGGRWYQTNRYGADLMRDAVRLGYDEGLRAGRADREDGWRYDYRSSYGYLDASYGYHGHYIPHDQYSHYFRQGFERGY